MKAGAKDVWNAAAPGIAARVRSLQTSTGHHPANLIRRQSPIGMYDPAAVLKMRFLEYVIDGRWTGRVARVAQERMEVTWLQRRMWVRCRTGTMEMAGKTARSRYLGQGAPRRTLA